MTTQKTAKTPKQRQAEYRARRKQQGLCAYPGCERKPRKYAYCPDHREDAKEQARDRTITAGMYESLLERHHALEHEVLQLRHTVGEQRDYFQLVAKVAEQERELATLNHRLARTLPEAQLGSTRLEPGIPLKVGIVA